MAANRYLTSHCAAAFLGCAVIAGVPATAFAENAAKAEPQGDVIRSIAVVGAERIEPARIVSYVKMKPGDVFSRELADEASKDLMATGLFASLTLANNGGEVVITVAEKTT